MPRSGRGGTRQGTPGTAYANRTDLQSNAPVPIQTAPGQQYGERAQQQAAQRTIPIAPPPAAPSPSAPGGASPPPGGGPPAPPGGGVPTPTPSGPQPLPGELPFLGPTARPTEPVTHGLKLGAGAGPEALTGVGALANNTAPSDSTVSLLASLAASPTAGSALRDLAGLSMENRS